MIGRLSYFWLCFDHLYRSQHFLECFAEFIPLMCDSSDLIDFVYLSKPSLDLWPFLHTDVQCNQGGQLIEKQEVDYSNLITRQKLGLICSQYVIELINCLDHLSYQGVSMSLKYFLFE